MSKTLFPALSSILVAWGRIFSKLASFRTSRDGSIKFSSSLYESILSSSFSCCSSPKSICWSKNVISSSSSLLSYLIKNHSQKKFTYSDLFCLSLKVFISRFMLIVYWSKAALSFIISFLFCSNLLMSSCSLFASIKSLYSYIFLDS